MSQQDIEMDDATSTESEHGRTDSNADLPDDEQTSGYTNSVFAPRVKADPDAKHSASSPAPIVPDMTHSLSSGLKKKGTAATKKGMGRKKLVNGVKLRAAREQASEDGPEDSNSDAETDNGPYCICRGPDDHRWMIGCEVCEDWFHGTCVDLSKDIGERLVERFVCPNCTDGRANYTKFRKTCSLQGCTNSARLFGVDEDERSIFCSAEHCDLWWISTIKKLPTRAASGKAIEALTQEDFMGLLVSTTENGASWKLGESLSGKPSPVQHCRSSAEYSRTDETWRRRLGRALVEWLAHTAWSPER